MTLRRGFVKKLIYLLEPGESIIVETTLETYRPLMTAVTSNTRYAAGERHKRFTAALYTCVGTSAGDVRYCVRIERIEDKE